MGLELLTFLGTVIAAAIGATGVYVGKKLEIRATAKAKATEGNTEFGSVALGILQDELDRKHREVIDLANKLDEQDRDIADLRVSNWLVLQHLLDVHRHFAEGNPPPPPPIPPKLLEHLREG